MKKSKQTQRREHIDGCLWQLWTIQDRLSPSAPKWLHECVERAETKALAAKAVDAKAVDTNFICSSGHSAERRR